MQSVTVEPQHPYNQALVANVHPPDWVNPQPAPAYNLVVIGAGTAGLVTAAGAAGLGSEVALIERHLMGGDCLNVGCVPSKALIRSAWAAFDARDGNGFGVVVDEQVKVEFPAVMERMRRLRSGISRHDSVKRFHDLGVDVFLGEARFTGNESIEVAEVKVNGRLQTTNPSIYAAGDVCFPFKFTHTADAMARKVIQNALFLGRKHTDSLMIPWCTYTDPEVAHVGIYESDARKEGIEVGTYVQSFDSVDRAITDGEEDGFVKVHVKVGTDRILGATIVARHAGEMISELTLAMTLGAGLGKLSGVIHPYPTQAEAIRKAADAYNRTRLTPLVRRLFKKWLAWTR